jgi:hypothetical protein
MRTPSYLYVIVNTMFYCLKNRVERLNGRLNEVRSRLNGLKIYFNCFKRHLCVKFELILILAPSMNEIEISIYFNAIYESNKNLYPLNLPQKPRE